MMRTRRRSLLDESGRPTGRAVRLYTEGDCWYLAFTVGRMLNAPLVALALADDPEDWVHVAVDLGRERLLDVLGVRTRDESMVFWETRARAALVFRELGRHGSLQDFLKDLDSCRLDMMLTRQDEDDVAEVADSLVARFQAEEAQHA